MLAVGVGNRMGGCVMVPSALAARISDLKRVRHGLRAFGDGRLLSKGRSKPETIWSKLEA